jgi:hypothetical protein
MGVLYAQASFRNSRITTRKPTTQAFTYEFVIPANTYMKILDADPTRTYLTIINYSTVDSIRYSYGNIGAAIDTDGMPLTPFAGADLESPQELWVKNMSVTNPITVQVDLGEA